MQKIHNCISFSSLAAELNVHFNGQHLKHDAHDSLGITMDRSLTFRFHLQSTGLKVAARNNLISKLAGTNRGASATTLRTSALALC